MDKSADSFELDVEQWDAWSPAEAACRLDGVEAAWYVTAGWALDLFRGRQTRPHDDLEIGVPAHQFPAIRAALAQFELVVVGDGHGWPSTDEALAAHHQTWVREGENWKLDVFREPWEDDVWVFRRDPRIRMHGSRLVSVSADGIPYARPEVVLLFKAAKSRDKDEEDFASVLPLLDAERRRWLAKSLELVHPGHPWLRPLA